MISQRTYTGRRMNLEAPTPEMICLEDIVQGLGHCCRFAGQVDEFYSVAQHAVLVSLLVDRPFAWPALHHDDTEAYMGDMSRNLKHHPLLDGYRIIENNLAEVIGVALNCSMNAHAKTEVKAADDLAAIYEHWTFRRRQRWDPKVALEWAVSEGFVRTPYARMLRLEPRLPEPLVALPGPMARRWFMEHVERFKP